MITDVKGNNVGKKLNDENKKKAEWSEASNIQNAYLKNVQPLKHIDCINSTLIVPKHRIQGYSKTGSIIVPDGKNSFNEHVMEFALTPHRVVAADNALRNTIGLEIMNLVYFEPMAQPMGEFFFAGVAFYIFQSHSVISIVSNEEIYKNDKF